MNELPVLSILQCFHWEEDERRKLLAETDVESDLVIVFFQMAEGIHRGHEVQSILDELADLGECVRVVPHPDPEGPDRLRLSDHLIVALAPRDALGTFRDLFNRPTVSRSTFATWSDRSQLEKILLEGYQSAAIAFDSSPETLLDQAKTFILNKNQEREGSESMSPMPSHQLEQLRNSLTRPKGFRAGGVHCGVKKSEADLGILFSDSPAAAAARFTKNRFQSPAVVVSRDHLKKGDVRAVVECSGIANAATGERGLNDARKMAELAAEALGLESHQVLVFSTGLIGAFLPMDKIEKGIRETAPQLARGADDRFVRAMMTTDTKPKFSSRSFMISGVEVTIGGAAKGSGMIHPDLATMHVFLTTDASIEPYALDRSLGDAVDETFNALTVDGDTSTSDAVLILANGQSGVETLTLEHPEYDAFASHLKAVCVDLARQLAADGEGANHLVRVVCEGAADRPEALQVAKAIANSLLVKTALFGRDPNWGRIIAALGNTSARYDPERVKVWIGGLLLFENGMAVEFERSEAARRMGEVEVEVKVDLGEGESNAAVYTCDLSYDYVRINAEYHT